MKLPNNNLRYEECELFADKCDMAAMSMNGPVVVEQEGRKITLSEGETTLLFD